MIKGLHHKAYRCRNSEETRQFYEDFLGLSLAGALAIQETKTGRETKVLHSFYRMDDGSFIAFFEAPDRPFTFTDHHDYDLHLALEVSPDDLHIMLEKARQLVSKHAEFLIMGLLIRSIFETLMVMSLN